jgi:hypothetical protein
MALRTMLRETLQPGERLLGFGTADTAGPGWRALTLLAPALPIGSLWTARLLRRRRVLLLTDRRLVILPPDQPTLDSRAIRWNSQFPLAQIEVSAIGGRALRIRTPDGLFIARRRSRWSGLDLSTADPRLHSPHQAR